MEASALSLPEGRKEIEKRMMKRRRRGILLVEGFGKAASHRSRGTQTSRERGG